MGRDVEPQIVYMSDGQFTRIQTEAHADNQTKVSILGLVLGLSTP